MTSGLFGDDFVIKTPVLDATRNPAFYLFDGII
jgi:hypothetical protein